MITQEKVRLLDSIDLEVAAQFDRIPPHKDGTPLDPDERVLLATVSRDDLRGYVDVCSARVTRNENRAAAALAAHDYVLAHGATSCEELLDQLDNLADLKHFGALLAEALDVDATR